MGASVSKSYSQPFCLDIESIHQIKKLNKTFFGKTTYTLYCNDDITREYEDISQVEEHSNTPQNRIKYLIIKAQGDEFIPKSRIRFSRDFPRTIEIDIQGDEQDVERYYQKISEIFYATKPWYGPISNFSLVAFFLVIMLMTMLAIGLAMFFDIVETSENSNDAGFAEFLASFSVAATFLAGLALIDFFKDRLFPLGAFLIGYELKVHKTRENIRWVIVSVFITSTLGALSWMLSWVIY